MTTQTTQTEAPVALLDHYYTIPEMGALVGYDRTGSYRIAHELLDGVRDHGGMPAPRRVLGRLRFVKEELDAFLEANRPPARQQASA